MTHTSNLNSQLKFYNENTSSKFNFKRKLENVRKLVVNCVKQVLGLYLLENVKLIQEKTE